MSVANWSKSDLLITLVTFDSTWWHFITADLPMNLQARLCLCSSCGSWVMLQIVLKRKFFIKRLPSHQLPYIKLLFKLHALYYTDVQYIQQNNRLNHYTKRRKSIFSGWTTIGGIIHLNWTHYSIANLKQKFLKAGKMRVLSSSCSIAGNEGKSVQVVASPKSNKIASKEKTWHSVINHQNLFVLICFVFVLFLIFIHDHHASIMY